MHIKLRELMLPPLVIATALALLATCAVAQQTDPRTDLYLHRLPSAGDHLESVAPRPGVASEAKLPSMDGYALEIRPGDLITLRRNFARSIVDRTNALLGAGVQEAESTEAALSFARTAFSFSAATTRVHDLRGLALDSRTSQVMGFSQGFGQGEGASTLSLTRSVTTQTPYLGATTTATVQGLQFHSGLGKKGSDLLLKATQSESDAKGRPRELALQGALKLTFSGGEAPFTYFRSHKEATGLDVLTEKMDAVIPIAMNGQKAIAEYHHAFITTNGVEKGTRTIHLGLPLRLFGQNASFDHLIAGKNEGAGMAETATTRLTAPFKIAGGLFTSESVYLSLRQPGVASDTLRTKLLAPLFGGIATLQHQTVSTETAAGLTEQEQLAVILPNIKVGSRLAFTGQHVATDNSVGASTDVTNVSVTARPFKPWQIDAQWQINDVDPVGTTTSTQVRTRFAFNDKTALEGRLTEAQVIGTSPNTLRLLELVRDRGNSAFGLRAGVAYYGAAGVEMDDAHRFEITAGKPSSLALTASYSEYNPNTFARYPTDPTLAVSLQHGDPSRFAVRLRYEDQAARLEPLEAIEVAMKALGGTLQMSYQANPLGPDGKTVRDATQYDASIGRKLFGDLNLQLGYRHVDYDQATDLTAEHFRIQLDGGQEARGGKFALAYLSGDFAPRSTSPSVVTPGSTLDLSYARTWGSAGRVTLSIKRHTAASANLGDDSTEGRVEFTTAF